FVRLGNYSASHFEGSANDNVVHLYRFRKANGLAHQAFSRTPQRRSCSPRHARWSWLLCTPWQSTHVRVGVGEDKPAMAGIPLDSATSPMVSLPPAGCPWGDLAGQARSAPAASTGGDGGCHTRRPSTTHTE